MKFEAGIVFRKDAVVDFVSVTTSCFNSFERPKFSPLKLKEFHVERRVEHLVPKPGVKAL